MIRSVFMRKILLACMACFIFLYSSFAQANDNAVKKLETLFNGMLEQYRVQAESSGAELVMEGTTLVEPSNNYYAVTLPHLTIKYSDGSRTDIGMIAINALPGDTPEQWKMTVAVPTPISHYDKSNVQTVKVDIGSQNFAGIWHEKAHNFIKMNAIYNDITATQKNENIRVLIPSIKTVYDLQENDKGLWSGPAGFTISDFQIFFDDDGSSGKIGRIYLESSIKDYALDAVAAYQEKINALAESYDTDDAASTSGEHVVGLYNLVTDFLSNAWDGFDFTMGLKDMTLNKAAKQNAPAETVTLGSALFGFGMNGMKEGSVSLNFKTAYDGFKFVPINENDAQSVPDHFNLDLGIHNLPLKEIVELGKTSVQGIAGAPQSASLVGLNAVMILPQLLTKAQTHLLISDLALGNEQYNMAATAKFTADLAAAMGATGNAQAEILGIDNLIQALNATVSDPATEEEKKQHIQQTLAGLSIVKMIGQMEKNAAGQDVRTYDFQLDAQGKALLNGTDLQMLMQGAQQPQ